MGQDHSNVSRNRVGPDIDGFVTCLLLYLRYKPLSVKIKHLVLLQTNHIKIAIDVKQSVPFYHIQIPDIDLGSYFGPILKFL